MFHIKTLAAKWLSVLVWQKSSIMQNDFLTKPKKELRTHTNTSAKKKKKNHQQKPVSCLIVITCHQIFQFDVML